MKATNYIPFRDFDQYIIATNVKAIKLILTKPLQSKIWRHSTVIQLDLILFSVYEKAIEFPSMNGELDFNNDRKKHFLCQLFK